MLLVCLVCTVKCLALSPPGISWVRGYTDGTCESHNHAGVQTDDGGFLLVGDGECYDSPEKGFTRQITVAKVDPTGNMQWLTNVGTVGFNYGKNGVELPDGTFLVVGAISEGTKANFVEKRVIIRFSKAGTVLHTQTFENVENGGVDGLMGVAIAGPKLVVVTGYVKGVQTYTDQPMFLIQGGYAVLTKLWYSDDYTEDFKVIFEHIFDKPQDTTSFTAYQGMRVVVDEDGYTFSAASYTTPEDGNTNFGLVRTDVDGNVRSMTYLPPSDGYQSHPYAFTAASDTGYVIAGLTLRYVDDSPQGRILKVSSTGEVEFDTSFRQERKGYSTECYGVSICSDGGYIVACGTGPETNQGSEPWQNLVQRVDRRGISLWKKVYTGENSRNGTGEYVVTDRVRGGYAIYMDTQDWGDSGTGGNFAIMHLDQD